jgi:P-type Na+/K+ transporter
MDKKKQDQLESHVSGQANKPLSRPAHALAYHSVIEEIKADAQDGLTTTEAKSRLEEYGRNEFGDSGGVQPAKILLRQVANAMTLVMLTTFFAWERRTG